MWLREQREIFTVRVRREMDFVMWMKTVFILDLHFKKESTDKRDIKINIIGV